MRAARWLVVLLWLCLCLPAAQARRLALVIGNDNYQQIGKLDNAGRDAEAVAKELELAGFEVSLRRDLAYRRMVVAFEEFYDKVKAGDELVVFYAGHGVQTERGAYLLPVDIEGETASQIEKMSYAVNNLLEELDRMKSRVALVVVDACRDNPLRVRGRTVGAARGLSGPDVSRGQMVIFSAGRNQKALDTLGPNDKSPNGVFARELLPRMRSPGLSIEAMAIDLRNAVERAAQSVRHEQRPLIVSDLVGEFFLYPAAAGASPPVPPAAIAAAAAAAPDAASREDRFWDDAKSADNVEAYEAYLATYPDGRYRGLARAHLTRLRVPPVASVAQSSRGTGDGATVASTVPPQPPTATPGAPPPQAGAPHAAPTAPEVRTRTAYALPNGDRYEGEMLRAMRSGQGTYLFASGDRYVGQFVDNQFMGQGVMSFANGDRFEGLFRGTTKHGPGVMEFANKDRYVGDFVDDLYDGKGTFVFATGERYSGDYRRGLKHGQGDYLYANKDRYVGAFDNDKPHGKGAISHANGDRYEGDFVQGLKQGTGVLSFANGDRYEGPFEAGVISGRGRLYMANGDRYEGDFRNDLKEGQGTYSFANKDRFEGGFVQGMQQGRGTHFFANGDRYEGEFAKGVRHGKGVHSFASGQARETEYLMGVEKP